MSFVELEEATEGGYLQRHILATGFIARRHPSKLQPLRRCYVKSATQTILNVLHEIVLHSFRYHSRRVGINGRVRSDDGLWTYGAT